MVDHVWRNTTDTVVPFWLRAFPELERNRDAAWREVIMAAKTVRLPAQSLVFRQGDECTHYLLMLEGSVRVYRVSRKGREIVLYRIGDGQTCPVTAAMLLSGQRYPAEAVVERDSHIVLLPAKHFHYALDKSSAFRQFVCQAYSERIGDFIVLLEEVAFGHVDTRLAQWLLSHSDGQNPIEASHRELATELGTAREVVSRQLKEFERCGWVKLGRRRIHISDSTGLAHLTMRRR